MKKMKILAIDTSNRPLSVAVLDNDHLLAETTLTTHRKHAEFLMPVIEDLIQKSDLLPNDLNRIVVASGPGSYTGIRMATTAAKTLASTLDIELVTVSSLLTLALNISEPGGLINPIFDARNQNMFTGLYQLKNGTMTSIISDQHTNINDWLAKLTDVNQPIMIVGDTAPFSEAFLKRFGDSLRVADELTAVPNAARLGLYGSQSSPVKNIDAVVPRYLRLTKAEADWQKLHPNEDTRNYVEKI
ncbi:tRNA (adenosine(37)-N6)-threonylcarbamoyltransferase complex dimerization subunit type 1 TsaB [Lentilactobacillus hilgardii]|nr:tRNA (adenosine(37)-N6)-threonylcarbamoyltransferase complex dimerization subunit type 1 TsaB [Lentilactobacillus hilgardii]